MQEKRELDAETYVKLTKLHEVMHKEERDLITSGASRLTETYERHKQEWLAITGQPYIYKKSKAILFKPASPAAVANADADTPTTTSAIGLR